MAGIAALPALQNLVAVSYAGPADGVTSLVDPRTAEPDMRAPVFSAEDVVGVMAAAFEEYARIKHVMSLLG